MEGTIDIRQLLKIIKKHLLLLIILPILFIILAAVLTFFVMSPKYEASTQILVNQNENNYDTNPQSVQNNLQLVNTYSEIVKSPRILDEVTKKLKNKYDYDELNQMVNVTNQAESQIINISVVNISRDDAERIANTIAEVYRDEMPNIMNIDNVSILSQATDNVKQIAPKTLVNLVIGFILGLIIALLVIFIKEMLDQRIKTEEDVEEHLNLPVLGKIEKY